MAFNKGLQLKDSNVTVGGNTGLVFDSVYLAPDKAFFQSKLVTDSGGVNVLSSQGSAVFTIRPDKLLYDLATSAIVDGDAAILKQELVVGQNIVLGIEFNSTGDKFRLLVQAREDYDATGANELVKETTSGAWTTAGEETTFGVTYNDNGTVSLQQTGVGLQILSLPNAYTPKQTTITLVEDHTPASNDVTDLIVDDGRGNVMQIGGVAQTATTAGDNVDHVVDSFIALSTEGRAGFVVTDDAIANEMTIKRTDGAGFTIKEGTLEVQGGSIAANGTFAVKAVNGLTQDAAAVTVVQDIKAATPLYNNAAATHVQETFFNKNFDGFVSQFAEFGTPLSVADMSSYVNNPVTIPSPTLKTDVQPSKAVITVGTAAAPANTTDNGKLYNFELDDSLGNKLNFTYTDTGGAAFTVYAADVKSDFDALADKKGFALDTTSNTKHFIFSRADGADFSVGSGNGAGIVSDYATNKLVVNGVALVKEETVFTSRDVGVAALTTTEAATPVAAKYVELVLDGPLANDITFGAFVPGTTAKDAIKALDAAFDALADKKGFTVTDNTGGNTNVIYKRADGKNFTAKLGVNDTAGNIQGDHAGAVATLTKDTAVATHVGSFGGVLATTKNNVIQKIDFTSVVAIVGGVSTTSVKADAPSTYAGEVTLNAKGLKKTVVEITGIGNRAADGGVLLSDSNSLLTSIGSTGYSGAAVASSGTASDVVYAQVTNRKGTTETTVDFFIDSARVGAAGYKSVNFDVAHDANLSVKTLTIPNPTSGYKLGTTDPTANTFKINWFQPAAKTDFTKPIATVVFTDGGPTNTPNFTFSKVDVNGVDYTDGSTYSTTFADTVNAQLYDIDGELESGIDKVTKVGDHLVTVTGFKDASANAPAPTSGLHLDLAARTATASSTSKNMAFTTAVKTQTLSNDISFQIDMPATGVVVNQAADVAADPAKFFVLDAALAGSWTINAATVAGHTLTVDLSGTTNAAIGATVGTFKSIITGGYGKTHVLELENVNVDADAAFELGRDMYINQVRTNAKGLKDAAGTDIGGDWKVADMPNGVVSRVYDGTATKGNAVTALDAYYALQIASGLSPQWYTGASALEGQIVAADFDASGKVTAADALAILEHTVSAVNARVVYKFFDVDTTTVTTILTAITALSQNEAVAGANTSLVTLGDEVVLVGDISNPAI